MRLSRLLRNSESGDPAGLGVLIVMGRPAFSPCTTYGAVVTIGHEDELMDTKAILAQLSAERDHLDQAIAALESLDGTAPTALRSTTSASKAIPTKKRRLTPAGRKRISEMMKARWTARRKAAKQPISKKPSGRRTMSPAARKKIAEAQRKRWAAQKAEAKTE